MLYSLLVIACIQLIALGLVLIALADLKARVANLPTKQERLGQLKQFAEAAQQVQRSARRGSMAVQARLDKRGVTSGDRQRPEA